MNNEIPCFDCDIPCNFIMVSYCPRLLLYLKIKDLDCDSNETKIQEKVVEKEEIKTTFASCCEVRLLK